MRMKASINNSFRITAMVVFLIFLCLPKVFSNVNITAPAVTVYPCSTFPTPYANLGNIVITEGATTDFGNGAAQAGVTLVLAAPANFQFEPGVGSVSYTAGRNITAASVVVTATEITVTFSNCAGGGCGAATDVMTISGIRVRGITAPTTTSMITRGGGSPWGGTAVINGAVVGGLTYGSVLSTSFPSAFAGNDQTICASSSSFEAAAITDPNLTGTWTLVSGGGTITTPNSATSAVTGLPLGDNTFRWTVTNGAGCSSSSLVTITSMASGLGCNVPTNQFSAVTAISPAMASQDVTCPPSSVNITQFTLANPGPFNVGDKVLVIQMAGATVNTAAAAIETGGADDNVFGSVTNYNGAGNYEYAVIATKVGSVVTFSQNLANPYNVNGKVQLVTVPQLANYTLSGTLTGTPWNSTTGTGGVLVFEVIGTLTLNGGTISMDYRGFIGGGNAVYPGAPMTGTALSLGVWVDGTNTAKCAMGRYSAGTATLSTALRGEGIALDPNHLYGRGALANGGGSGGGWNSGAGGGSNICPGGRGGYEYSSCYNNMGVNPFYVGVTPTYNSGIGSQAANLQSRMHGLGGYGLTATSSRVFMGGGGGAANGDGASATAGGNGGGIIIITANTIAGTSGTITANGQRGYANNIAPYNNTVDGTGGGGGGGSVLLDVTTYSIGALTVRANGGKGGNQDQANTCHGNGGGGGGGLIRHKGITPNVTLTVTGGNIGVQRPSPNTDPDTDASLPLSNDNSCAGGTTYGATAGGGSCAGSTQQLLIVVPQKGCCTDANLGSDQTLCGTGSVLLTNGTASNTNKTFKWYKNGVLIGGATGSTYTATSVGTYSVVADSIVGGFNYCSVSDAAMVTNSFPIPYLGPNQVLCSPSYLDLVPSNAGSFPSGTTWSWAFNGSTLTGVTTSNLNGVTDAGTYTVTASTGVAGCGPTSGSITLQSILPTVVDGCRTTTGSVNLSVSGGNGGPYEWYAASTGGSAIYTGTTYTTPSLSSTTTYWVKDLGLYQTTIGPTTTMATGGTFGSTATISNHNITFDLTQDIQLRGMTLRYWANNSCGGANATYTINITNSSTGYSQTRTGTAGPCGAGAQTYTVTFSTPFVIPAGTGYVINSTGSSNTIVSYSGPFTYPSTYSSMLKFIKTTNGSSDNDAYPNFTDWQISYNTNCSRVPVVAQIGGSCGPLPVTYVDFKAALEESIVYLDWSTASEKDNAYFDVQRSLDGSTFETIGRVNGKGTSNVINSYFFADRSVPATNVYYRLQQTDRDGQTSYSKVVTVFNDKAAVVSLYPNPFTEQTNLLIYSRFEYAVTVKMFDLNGREVYSAENLTNQQIELGKDLKEGVYIVEVQSEFENKRVRVVKMDHP